MTAMISDAFGNVKKAFTYVLDIFKGIRFSLIMLYIATFVMRFSAYLCIALLGYTVDITFRGIVIAFYSVMEILTVSFFGVYSDTHGRKPVLIISHVLTTLGVLLFAILAFVNHQLLTTDLVLIVFVYLPIMTILGAGAAAKVASTMTMIADESSIETRAQYMGFFDLATLGGFGAGLAAGSIFYSALKFSLDMTYLIGLVTVIVSVIMVIVWVEETLTPKEQAQNRSSSNDHSLTRVMKIIKSNKDLQVLLPVYIPMISLYGILVNTASDLLKPELSNGISHALIMVVGIIGVFTGGSMLVMGKVSDRLRIRRPFIILGLFSLAILIALFEFYYITTGKAFEGLYSIWPITMILSWGLGMFPPAILAYLTDISKKDTRGSLFGVKSVIIRAGMIIGPIISTFFATEGLSFFPSYGDLIGINLCIFLMVILSSIVTLFLKEKAIEEVPADKVAALTQ